MKKQHQLIWGVAGALSVLLAGCASPEVSQTTTIALDNNALGGAIDSSDVRTVASKMTPAILAVPEIANHAKPVRIALAGFKNSSRFIIDKNIFQKKLRLELNKYGAGQVRFFAQEHQVNQLRQRMLTQKQSDLVDQELDQIAQELAAQYWVKSSPKTIKMAVLPVINTNLVDMNADSFTAKLRSKVAAASKGKIKFLMPGKTRGADYFLAGQFYVESTKKEGIVNLLDYTAVLKKRLEQGVSLDLTDGRVPKTSHGTAVVRDGIDVQRESELVRLMRDQSLRNSPNLDKNLNIMVVAANSDTVEFEKQLRLERKITDKIENANFILTGEISSMSQRRQGRAADYLLISVQLSDPESNEVVWEDSYETKRLTNAGIVYQ